MKEEGYSVGRGVVHKLIILLKLYLHKVDASCNIAYLMDLLQILKMLQKQLNSRQYLLY
jgi:hypothetical protein